eukprot:CAMPEP_0182841742 /NCGR_PEP_ID=MMETSP0006_2-20121128/25215_1 /TAXON_ID=97485 /ORGANISM="Prymnesium parvum, Strain Texoma1" /LENGTH=571 /DNA_ID=CAMNT_0024971285 /DNA_START=18 /DNA_END=1734 /DNA_ORIENTATION=+
MAPKAAPGTLILVRHGSTPYSKAHTFTGWADPDIDAQGKAQALSAATSLLEAGYSFDVAYTSMLKRSIHTTWLLLGALDKSYVEVRKTWRLNERSYGGLTGRTTDELLEEHGEAKLKAWRRSLDSQLPPYGEKNRYHPKNDRRYQRFEGKPIAVPEGETMREMVARCQPVWHDDIVADLKEGRSVLVVGHGNTLRALVGAIENLPVTDLAAMEMPQCIPLVYRFERDEKHGTLRPIRPERPSRVNAERVLRGEFLATAAALDDGFDAASEAPLAVAEGAEAQDGKKRQYVVIIRHGKTEHNKLGLFTGWEDVSLAPEGRAEAREAGRMMARHGIQFDVVYTSWLSRAIETAWLALVELDQLWLPINKSWRLNERMYGALTGLSKKKTRTVYGETQFKLWRRSYDTPPPAVSSFSEHYPGNDPRYVRNIRDVRVSLRETLIRSLERGRVCIHRKLPRSESLKDCMDRTIPYWIDAIERNAIAQGKSVLVASSENAIRGLLMHLFNIPEERISEIEIPTGLPLVYDTSSRCLSLLEGDFSDHNFGASGELLFTPCALDYQTEGSGAAETAGAI